MFICGSRSSVHQHEDRNGSYISSHSTPKRSKRSKIFSKFAGKDNINKNPYADRGLDKFFALVADLDEKKQKIYNQMGFEDVSFIRFVYSDDSQHVKPIVVKVKRNKNKNILIHPTNHGAAALYASDKNIEQIQEKRENIVKPLDQELVKRYQRWNGSFRMHNPKEYNHSFPLTLVFILLFLAICGRSFAIIFTSIVWYLVPQNITVERSTSPSSSSSSRRDLKRRVSENQQIMM